MSIVSATDFSRIRSSVQPPVRTDKETRRANLKKKSTSRTEKWPNTLEAMREKKDNWKLEKEENEERRRLAIDANELRLQKEVRLQQIERANNILYEQTDKMKTLRSKQLLADVVQVLSCIFSCSTAKFNDAKYYTLGSKNTIDGKEHVTTACKRRR